MQSYFEPAADLGAFFAKLTASYIKVNNPNAIEEPVTIFSSAISVYPNPTNGELRVGNVVVYDMMGSQRRGNLCVS